MQQQASLNSRRTRRRRIVILLVALAAGLALGELVIRVTGVDWRYLKKNLWYYDGYHANTMADPNDEIRFRLRPNSHSTQKGPYGGYTVDINAQGARGPERRAAKPPGVTRVFCMGGSNVFGTGVKNEEAWPAQLEMFLNAKGCGKFEVWNYGTSCHVGAQTAHLAWESMRYEPDAIVFALSNTGQRAFLMGEPVEPYFEKNPELWLDYLPRRSKWLVWFLPRSGRVWLFEHSRLLRFSVMAAAEISGGFGPHQAWTPNHDEFERVNCARMREFISQTKGKTKSFVFIGPYAAPPDQSDEAAVKQGRYYLQCIPCVDCYWKGLDVPVYYLSAQGHSDEYRKIHPPPYVLAWYASKLADWLIEQMYPGLKPWAIDSGP
jgi:hypothetical protein